MKDFIRISKLLQIALLLTFLLPFFPRRCTPTNKEKEEQRIADSVLFTDSISHSQQWTNRDSTLKPNSKSNDNRKDSIAGGSIAKDQAGAGNKLNPGTDSAKGNEVTNNSGWSTWLSKKSRILELMLRPSGNYSGLGYMVDGFVIYVFGYGILTAFLLLIIGLIIKLKDFNGYFYLLNGSGWLFILIATPGVTMLTGEAHLWGYWTCLILGFMMLLFDSILLIKIRKDSKIMTRHASRVTRHDF